MTESLAQLADNLNRKPNKTEIQHLIQTMYEETEDHRLAQLYKYFMPAMPKKPKNVFQWVALAVSTDKTRPYLHKVYSDGENIVATNGHILHLAPDGRPEGFYCPITEEHLPDYCGAFPNKYKEVIPEKTDTYILKKELVTLPDSRGVAYKSTVGGFVYDKKPLDKCLSYGEPESYSGGKPMRMDFKDDRVALIMPEKM